MQAKTRQEEAYTAIRADILSGRLEPGQKLPFSDLAASYPFSIGVIREALSRLVEQELVVSAPQQGFSVTPISARDLVNLTVARREIESLTLRHAVAEGSVAWQSEVLAAHHRLASIPIVYAEDTARVSEEWAQAHSTFHETLLLGCDNPRLTSVATQLRASAELYRRWSVPLGHGEARDIASEHRALMDAVLARDADLACRLLDEHISMTTELLLDFISTTTEA